MTHRSPGRPPFRYRRKAIGRIKSALRRSHDGDDGSRLTGRRKSTSVRSSMEEQGRSQAALLAVRRVERTSAADGRPAGGNLKVRTCRQRPAGAGLLVLHELARGWPGQTPHPTRLPLLFRASSGALLAGVAGAPGREREERGAREGRQGRERRERARSRPNRRVAPLAASRDFYILRFLYPVIFTSPRRAEAQNSRNISGSHSEEPSNFSV